MHITQLLHAVIFKKLLLSVHCPDIIDRRGTVKESSVLERLLPVDLRDAISCLSDLKCPLWLWYIQCKKIASGIFHPYKNKRHIYYYIIIIIISLESAERIEHKNNTYVSMEKWKERKSVLSADFLYLHSKEQISVNL